MKVFQEHVVTGDKRLLFATQSRKRTTNPVFLERGCYNKNKKTSILEEKHTVPVDKLCNITVELHDIGLVDSVVLGAATFKVSLQTLYPAGACGFFDLVPPGGQPGLWKEQHANSYAVCELSFAPQYHPTAPSCLLTSLFADPCPLVSQQAMMGAFGAEPPTKEIGGHAVQGGGHVGQGGEQAEEDTCQSKVVNRPKVQQPSEASEVLLVQGTPVRKADPTKAPSPHKADPPKAPSPAGRSMDPDQH